jgi:hypothetical protein
MSFISPAACGPRFPRAVFLRGRTPERGVITLPGNAAPFVVFVVKYLT